MDFTPTSIVAICVALPLLDLVAVSLRFWMRLRLIPSSGLGIDDWLILGAFVFLLGDAANLIVATTLELQGRNYQGPFPPERGNLEAITDHVMDIIEKPVYAMMKLSFLFFFRRIFVVKKSFRQINNFLICSTIAWGLAFTIAELSICGGQADLSWDPQSMTTCANHKWLDLIFSITDVIGDILIMALPYPYIRQLKISLREKIAITSIFLLGTLSTAACIVRLAFISQAFKDDLDFQESQYIGTPPAVWSTIEGAVGVLAACLPPLGPLLRRIPVVKQVSIPVFTRLMTWSRRRSDKSTCDEGNKLQPTTSGETMSKEISGPQIPHSVA